MTACRITFASSRRSYPRTRKDDLRCIITTLQYNLRGKQIASQQRESLRLASLQRMRSRGCMFPTYLIDASRKLTQPKFVRHSGGNARRLNFRPNQASPCVVVKAPIIIISARRIPPKKLHINKFSAGCGRSARVQRVGQPEDCMF